MSALAVAADPAWVLPTVLLVGVALLWTPFRRAGRIVATLAAAFLLAATSLPIAGWLTAALENRFPPPRALPAELTGIVVLGGGVGFLRDQPRLYDGADRLLHLAMLARAHPGARLVYSGNGVSSTEVSASTAALQAMGVDLGRVAFETRATNTWQNAAYTHQLLQPRPEETWVLVTSARHMPRAVASFRAVGWQVVPYPVGYTTSGEYTLGIGYSPTQPLVALSSAMHEWLGLAVYRLTGRTREMFPHP